MERSMRTGARPRKAGAGQGITIVAAYLVALWIASVWWTFRDIRSRTTDIASSFSGTPIASPSFASSA